MIYLLHIDTSADTGSVAVSGDGRLLASTVSTEARNHASAINLMIEDALKNAGITMQQLNAVVVCAGPGSYTGLRIGVSTAKGICYALNLPLLLDNKLTLIANQVYQEKKGGYSRYIPVMAARENEYFLSAFDNAFECVAPATHITIDQLAAYLNNDDKKLIISDTLNESDIDKYSTSFDIEKEPVIDLQAWSSYALEQYKCNKIVNLSTAEPFYLKQVYTHK